MNAPRFSFIVPFHRGLSTLAHCLETLDRRPPSSEVIVVADGAVEDCRLIARRHHARIVQITGPAGPAVARNAGVAAAGGDILVFVDADVVVSVAALKRLVQVFDKQPRTAAAFGAYDDMPSEPGFVSQYKNLSHSFIHHTSARKARTFWAGFGAVRREAFERVGGFDERFDRPSIEDIDLGYRLTAAGYEVLLDPALSARHLKRWTFGSAITSDVRDRGIPWTQLIWRYRALEDDLNLRRQYRASVLLAYLALASAALTLSDSRWLVVLSVSIVALTASSWRYYRFFFGHRGPAFAAKAWAMHFVQHVCNGFSFAVGTVLFVTASVGLRLPGSLPTSAWKGSKVPGVQGSKVHRH